MEKVNYFMNNSDQMYLVWSKKKNLASITFVLFYCSVSFSPVCFIFLHDVHTQNSHFSVTPDADFVRAFILFRECIEMEENKKLKRN